MTNKEEVRQPAGFGLNNGRVALPRADLGGSLASYSPFQSFLISPTTKETFKTFPPVAPSYGILIPKLP